MCSPDKQAAFTPPHQRNLLIISILAFISIYVGWYGSDPSLVDGKNIIHFTLIYMIGYELRTNDVIQRFSLTCVLTAYILFTVTLFAACSLTFGTAVSETIWRWSFAYNSPLNMIGATLLFLVFAKVHLHTRWMLWLSSSTFAIYLIHSNQHLGSYLWQLPDAITWPFLLKFVVLTIIVCTACIAIDKLCHPIYNRIGQQVTSLIDKRLKQCLLNK